MGDGNRGTEDRGSGDRGNSWRLGGPVASARMGIGKFATSGVAVGTRILAVLQAEVDALVREAVRLAETGASLLTPDYIQLVASEHSQELSATLRRILGMPGPLSTQAGELLRLLEIRFIMDPVTSSLDLLPLGERARFRTFQWHPHDYPGAPIGPNEGLARAMTAALNRIRPERRANTGQNAVVTKDEHTNQMQAYITRQLQPIPGRPGERLNIHALGSFVRMSQDAQGIGIHLIALNGYRSPETSAALASKSGNPDAVASFSVHNLGLAIDLQMSYGTQHYRETTTVPMENVVRMRQSPVHKWIFLRGASYGWFPLQNEPWHWEYNPPGFRTTFRAGL